ncbi:CMRF35-like molecule 8 [Anabas testudineus]|uniref:CMRF35-like molecule 8 n=1 Tax=Anabas testudineus TaxID=64144 RepID=UPI000E459CC9|nr:CMRF35-like molecule 8 [Anabas testudineus]
MQCPYPPQHGTNRKFLCKGDHHRNCTDMVTSQNSSGQTDVRFTLLDDVSSSSFSVTITELKAGDAGTYWCGSDSQWTFGNYTKIQLSLDVVVFNPVVFIVPAALMFITIFVLVVIYKYKCHKVQGTAARENRTTTRATDEEEADVRKPKSKTLLVDT